jgi:putative CocE/NonD family hydrolase
MDQRAIAGRKDYLRFETPTLTEDVAIAGQVIAELYAATSGTDTDFMAKLVDVYPDGYEALVLDCPIRTRYRYGRMPDDVTFMIPGVPAKLSIDLWSTAITFEAGHKIALHITSSNYPRFEVNPNTGEEPGSSKMPARVVENTIHHDRDRPSALVLPVVYPESP